MGEGLTDPLSAKRFVVGVRLCDGVVAPDLNPVECKLWLYSDELDVLREPIVKGREACGTRANAGSKAGCFAGRTGGEKEVCPSVEEKLDLVVVEALHELLRFSRTLLRAE